MPGVGTIDVQLGRWTPLRIAVGPGTIGRETVLVDALSWRPAGGNTLRLELPPNRLPDLMTALSKVAAALGVRP